MVKIGVENVRWVGKLFRYVQVTREVGGIIIIVG